jgi:acrylyl-CoA reductase (NADPH)
MTFKVLLAAKTGEAISTRLVEMNEQDLMPGDVTVAVDYSTVNYKDAMAITGRVDIIRQYPLIPGIDFAGTVEVSSYPGIAVGDRVVANSWGLSQTHHGGYAQKARVKGEWLVKIPAPFSTKDAMAIGTGTRRCCRCWRSNMAASHRSVMTSSSPAPMGAWAPSRSRSCPISAIASSRRPDVSRKAIICAASAPGKYAG